MDLSLGQDLAEIFAQAFYRFIQKQGKGNCNWRLIGTSVNWHFTGFQSGLYFCAEIPEPLFRGMVAVKGVAADTGAQTDARTTVRREAHASVSSDSACVPSALFLVCFCEEEEREPHLRKRWSISSKLNEALCIGKIQSVGLVWHLLSAYCQLKVTLEDYP